jgi:hypothetical protein
MIQLCKTCHEKPEFHEYWLPNTQSTFCFVNYRLPSYPIWIHKRDHMGFPMDNLDYIEYEAKKKGLI